MSDHHSTLANCTLHGIEMTHGTTGGCHIFTRNLLRRKAGCFELELLQDPNLQVNRSELIWKVVDTTNVHVRKVVRVQVLRFQEDILQMSESLILATESRVLPQSFE